MDQSSRARASAGTIPLSLEASLDEENKEVLAHLSKQRSASPLPPKQRTRSPQPYRSMLDVDPSVPRHGSLPGIGSSVTSPRDQRKPSKRLNPADPSTWTKTIIPPSPTGSKQTETAEMSTSLPSQGLPKIQIDSRPAFEQKYNFDMASMPLSGGGAKSTQEKKARDGSGSATKDFGERRASKELKSPATDLRANSPSTSMLTPDSPKVKPKSQSGVTTDDAQRRMSNKSSSFSTITDDSDDIGSRVMADEDGDEEAVDMSSSDEERRSESSDEGSPEARRGRSRDTDSTDTESVKESQVERKEAPQSQGVRSLLEPVLSPSVPKEPSGAVHPESSFGRSGPTAADFIDEDDIDADIKKAKTLGMSISPLDSSIPDRHVRMIIRGEWAKFQDDNENNNNSNPRLYLACTDLSTEASYAMEWTVGTMLRDGDTLLAIYAIEDENAPKEPEGNTQVMSESAKAAQDASDVMESLTRQTTGMESIVGAKFVPAIDAPSLRDSTDLSSMSRKEIERIKAIDDITHNFLKLVRKTPLQVRCMVEVIHCKSPKHLILNAIDALEPTLCVVGTRGRSSLKGVLLGSFSNYLVTKSSVPVMVARRKLRKPSHAKVSASVKMANNLSNPLRAGKRRDLAHARID